MKKLMKLSLVAIFVAVFVACSGSDDEKSVIGIYTRTIYVGDSVKIEGARTLVSADEFVAYTTKDGYIQAFHVGQTTVTVNGSMKIPVVVKGVKTGFNDPVTVWGCSKNYVDQYHTDGSFYEDKGNYVYYKGSGKILLYQYLFENGKLKNAATIVSLNNSVDYFGYLLERYLPIAETDGNYVFIDALSKNDCKTAIVFGYGSDCAITAFMDASSIFSSSSAKTQTRGMALDEAVLQKLKAAWEEAKVAVE